MGCRGFPYWTYVQNVEPKSPLRLSDEGSSLVTMP